MRIGHEIGDSGVFGCHTGWVRQEGLRWMPRQRDTYKVSVLLTAVQVHPVVVGNESGVDGVVRGVLPDGRLVVLGMGTGGPGMQENVLPFNRSSWSHRIRTSWVKISMTILIANGNGMRLGH